MFKINQLILLGLGLLIGSFNSMIARDEDDSSTRRSTTPPTVLRGPIRPSAVFSDAAFAAILAAEPAAPAPRRAPSPRRVPAAAPAGTQVPPAATARRSSSSELLLQRQIREIIASIEKHKNDALSHLIEALQHSNRTQEILTTHGSNASQIHVNWTRAKHLVDQTFAYAELTQSSANEANHHFAQLISMPDLSDTVQSSASKTAEFAQRFATSAQIYVNKALTHKNYLWMQYEQALERELQASSDARPAAAPPAAPSPRRAHAPLPAPAGRRSSAPRRAPSPRHAHAPMPRPMPAARPAARGRSPERLCGWPFGWPRRTARVAPAPAHGS